MDSFFLEEEKYEGNDLYKEYNKKEHKAKTEDDLNLTKKTTMQTAMHIEENENGMNIEENKENHNENNEKIKNERKIQIIDRFFLIRVQKITYLCTCNK